MEKKILNVQEQLSHGVLRNTVTVFEAYLEPSQTFTIELTAKSVNKLNAPLIKKFEKFHCKHL